MEEIATSVNEIIDYWGQKTKGTDDRCHDYHTFDVSSRFTGLKSYYDIQILSLLWIFHFKRILSLTEANNFACDNSVTLMLCLTDHLSRHSVLMFMVHLSLYKCSRSLRVNKGLFGAFCFPTWWFQFISIKPLQTMI